MKAYDLIVVGGGPAGLGAAIEAASFGASCIIFDENERPGGQLFKQIHKFFGSKEHGAGSRGFEIGKKLLKKASELHVEIRQSTTVWGIFGGNTVAAFGKGGESISAQGKSVVLAAGARENPLCFPGDTLPGVMTAGAAQTLANIYGVQPGKRAVIVGSGNVGLIVSYQLRQAGVEIAAIVEAAGAVSGYEVHAAKIRRQGIPILLSHTVKEARGNGLLEEVVVCKADRNYAPVPGTERVIKADTLCIAVGLTPRSEMASVCGCKIGYLPKLGGMVPLHDGEMSTSVEGIYVAGDMAGVEEASTALEEGRLAAASALLAFGTFDSAALLKEQTKIRARLNELRQGPVGSKIKQSKQIMLEKFHKAVMEYD